MAHKPGRPGGGKPKKGPTKGSGGQGRKALEGKGPTPKAEDRSYHVAGKRKAARERAERKGRRLDGARPSRDSATSRTGGHAEKAAANKAEIIVGRNSVVEALEARVPASTLHLAAGIDQDDRVRKTITLANHSGLAIVEVTRQELDRLAGVDVVHQGVALSVPPYQYANPIELFERVSAAGATPLLVALDGVTDPRNLGAIIRSTAAFGGHGVIIPQRRSAGLTASAWKASAGAAVRVPVALAGNLTQTLISLQAMGAFVVGLDGSAEMPIRNLQLASDPLVLVVGSEGKGLSRLVAQTCDTLASVPIESATESLNAGVAASIALYDVSQLRSPQP